MKIKFPTIEDAYDAQKDIIEDWSLEHLCPFVDRECTEKCMAFDIGTVNYNEEQAGGTEYCAPYTKKVWVIKLPSCRRLNETTR